MLLAANLVSGHRELADAMRTEVKPLTYTSSALVIAYIVGIFDDLKGVRYPVKFLAQTCCGLLMVTGGIFLPDLHGLMPIHSLPLWAAFPLSVFAIVFIINAINLIDGIDGLASGLCMFAFFCYSIIFTAFRQYIYALLSLAMVGVIAAFYYYNVFGSTKRNRRIFMGDTGSMTLGVMVSFLGFQVVNLHGMGTFRINTFVWAFAPLLVPCLDVVRVFLSRICHGTHPFLPDRNHIHHLLMDIGMGQHKAMTVIVWSSILLTAMNVVLSYMVNPTILLCTDIMIWIVASATISLKKKRQI